MDIVRQSWRSPPDLAAASPTGDALPAAGPLGILWRGASVRPAGAMPGTHALRHHVTFLGGRDASGAALRAAAPDDLRAVHRFLRREGRTAAPRAGRSAATLDVMSRQNIVHVAELQGRICAAAVARPAGGLGLLAEPAVISQEGRLFDAEMAARFVEHHAECCRYDGWPVLDYHIDFMSAEAAESFAARLRERGFTLVVKPSDIGPVDRLRFGRRSHVIRFVFAP